MLSLVVYAASTSVVGYRQQRESQKRIAQAYEFAIHNGEITSYLPCFCGCGKREGHSSVDSCFVSRRDGRGRMVSLDSHAERCAVCVNVVLDSERMLIGGATLAEIRQAVDAKYGPEYPSKTDTPMPPSTAINGPTKP